MAGRPCLAMEEHLFWIVSRAAGIAALLLSSAAVGVGLTMGGRMVKGRGLDLRAAHEALSLATLIAIVVHAVALLGDSYLNASVLDITVPFVSGYKEPWMSIGIVSGWALVALGVSYYFRTKIGVARWKKLHRWTALAWLAGHRALARRGHRRRHRLVPRLHGDRGRARARPPRRPPPPVHPRPLPLMSPTLLARRARGPARSAAPSSPPTVAVFLALFATIYIQMAAGKDPALGSSVTTAQVSVDRRATSSSTTRRPPTTSSSSDDDSASTESSSDTVTTAQS